MTIIETAELPSSPESSQSAVSWGAILAGAVVAAAVSVVMVLLGSGLGLSVVSPWSTGASAGTFAVSAAIWLVVMQWVASAFGGYTTGRLRTKWVGVHTDEVFFRDTAHGFIAWCVATLLVAGLLSSAVTSVVSTGVQATSSVVSGAAQGAVSAASGVSDPTGYFVDLLFRPVADRLPATTPQAADTSDVRQEAVRILANDVTSGTTSDEDKAYLAQLIAGRTGLSPADATKRVDTVLARIDDVKTKAKVAADAARKAALTMALLTVVSLLIGAFIASVSAAYAGRLRDDDMNVPTIRS